MFFKLKILSIVNILNITQNDIKSQSIIFAYLQMNYKNGGNSNGKNSNENTFG